MRYLVLHLVAAGGLVALVACGGKTPGGAGAGGATTTSGPGGGGSASTASSASSGGATTTTSASASGGGSGGAVTTTTASASGSGGASTTTSASSSSGAPTCTGTQSLCAGTCADLTTDPHDCGACGHDCLGAACSAGQCAATDVLVAQHISLLAVDPTRLFYTSAFDIDVVPLAGGTPQKINMPYGVIGLAATAFAIDESDVFWTSAASPETGWLLSVTKGGSNQTQLVNQLDNYGQPYALAPFIVSPGGPASYIVWVTHGDGQSSTIPLVVKTTLGGGSTVLATLPGKFLNSVALDATSAYALSPDGGCIYKVPLTGGTGVLFAGGFTSPTHVVSDAVNLYVTDLGSAAGAGKIIKVPLAGGPPVTLATNIANIAQIAVGASNVYVTSQYQTSATTPDGEVLAVPIAGGPVVTVASNQPSPGGITVDSTYVYWANYGLAVTDGGVRKAPL